MSARNTGLFLPGHLSAQVLIDALVGIPGAPLAELVGEEAPRLGHAQREGHAYTHVGLRLFEVAGLRLLDDDALPGPEDLEVALGAALSRAAGRAVYAVYEEEQGYGGAAVFEGGVLRSRLCFDARGTAPLRRDLSGATVLRGLDPSDWVWRPASDAIEAALLPVVGPGVRTDDELLALIEAASGAPLALPRAPTPPAHRPAEPPAARKRDRLLGLAKGLFGRG
ncbi:MAG: hypothetical protein RL071_746 [Pseudomonadota bacterium]|jgi:hypothetical protein